MSLKTIVPPCLDLWTESYICDTSLTARQYTLLIAVAAATGKYHVTTPGGQGVLTCGVLQNAPASGGIAEVRKLGTSKVVAGGKFNAGILLTVDGTNGQVEAAATGDYVIGVAGEGSAEAGQLVKVELCSVPWLVD